MELWEAFGALTLGNKREFGLIVAAERFVRQGLWRVYASSRRSPLSEIGGRMVRYSSLSRSHLYLHKGWTRLNTIQTEYIEISLHASKPHDQATLLALTIY